VAKSAFYTEIPFWAAVASLVWNFFNFIYTKRAQTKLRQATTNLDEFRSQIREPISEALRSLKGIKSDAHGLMLSSSAVSERKEEMIKINKAFARDFGLLQDALSNANKSSFASGEDWLHGIDDLQDDCLSQLDRATSPGRPDSDFDAAVNMFCSSIEKIDSHVNKRLELEVKRIRDGSSDPS